jgi:hypothetical protein
LMAPGARSRGTQFTCHATGSPEAIANTGNGEAVRYPPHN